MVNKLLTLSLALGIGVAFGLAINSAATRQAQAEVYAVCNSARLEISGKSEQACGDLQDKYGIEFLCQERNNLASNHCWTEAK